MKKLFIFPLGSEMFVQPQLLVINMTKKCLKIDRFSPKAMRPLLIAPGISNGHPLGTEDK